MNFFRANKINRAGKHIVDVNILWYLLDESIRGTREKWRLNRRKDIVRRQTPPTRASSSIIPRIIWFLYRRYRSNLDIIVVFALQATTSRLFRIIENRPPRGSSSFKKHSFFHRKFMSPMAQFPFSFAVEASTRMRKIRDDLNTRFANRHRNACFLVASKRLLPIADLKSFYFNWQIVFEFVI